MIYYIFEMLFNINLFREFWKMFVCRNNKFHKLCFKVGLRKLRFGYRKTHSNTYSAKLLPTHPNILGNSLRFLWQLMQQILKWHCFSCKNMHFVISFFFQCHWAAKNALFFLMSTYASINVNISLRIYTITLI